MEIVAQRLRELYEIGILNSANFTSLIKDSNNTVHVVEGKQAIIKPVKQLLTTLGAYENLFTAQQLSSKRSVLQHCNLNEYIVPNIIYDK